MNEESNRNIFLIFFITNSSYGYAKDLRYKNKDWDEKN